MAYSREKLTSAVEKMSLNTRIKLVSDSCSFMVVRSLYIAIFWNSHCVEVKKTDVSGKLYDSACDFCISVHRFFSIRIRDRLLT